MARTMAFWLGVSVLGAACSGARLKDDSGGTGTESETGTEDATSDATDVTGSGSGGQDSTGGSSSSSATSGDSGTPGFGVGGIVVFDPVPDEFPSGNELWVRLYGFDPEVEDHSEEIGRQVLEVSASPVSFFIPVNPNDYVEEWVYELIGEGDMDGDHDYTCGDYRGRVDVLEPFDPEHPYEVVIVYMTGWCP